MSVDVRILASGEPEFENGNWVKTSGIEGRVYRVVASPRGRFPGGRGLLFGTVLRDLTKDTPEERERGRSSVSEELTRIFVGEGTMDDLVVTVDGDIGNAIFRVEYLDLSIQENIVQEIPARFLS